MEKTQIKKVAIIGDGYVGGRYNDLVSTHYETIKYDPAKHETTREEVNDCDLSVVCVPTPQMDSGECDTSIIDDVFTWLRTPLVLIESTVPVGYTKLKQAEFPNRGIVFSPEYAGESKYWSSHKFHGDMKELPWITFGGQKEYTSQIVDFLMPILGPEKTYFQCESDVAEMAKYMENTFYATKITFCNQIFELCEGYGIDYNQVREAFLMDPRINRMHTAVFRDDRGFGGKCFPKDLSALIAMGKRLNIDVSLLESVKETNNNYREK